LDKIYITHCCAKKDDSLRGTGRKVPPDILYVATPTQRFMSRCLQAGVHWAIFSDLHGVWFPEVEHEWYEKDPDTVSEREFNNLLMAFDTKLQPYEAIFFYQNPGRFHPLYGRLIEKSTLKSRVAWITHLHDIR